MRWCRGANEHQSGRDCRDLREEKELRGVRQVGALWFLPVFGSWAQCGFFPWPTARKGTDVGHLG